MDEADHLNFYGTFVFLVALYFHILLPIFSVEIVIRFPICYPEH